MQKSLAFSLLELIVVISIVAILSATAIPAYKTYVIKVKIAQIFTTMNYYKLHITDAFINQDHIDTTITNPIDVITKLSLKTLNTKPTYLIQAIVDTKKLNLNSENTRLLVINLIGTLHDNFLVWECQIHGGYALEPPTGENCTLYDS
jgi:prepilin-type N-terminal cleavage/methylation domain-containing protein